MRIESVSFSGIGPFTKEHKIDFEALGPDALFLIEGPTGSGKSTILDAITFGIYGDAAGDESDVARLRSNHIPETQTSWVEVVFATKNAKFKVHREPKYKYAKASGKGESEKKQVLRVYKEVEPGIWGPPVTESVREGEIYLHEQIGLDRNQFAQTVMLPQGQFSKFLKADTKERQPILERIFKTQRFKEILEALKRRAKSASDEITNSAVLIKETLIHLAGQTRMDEETLNVLLDHALSPEKDQELLKDLKEITRKFNKELEDSEFKFEEIEKKFQAASKALEDRKKESAALESLTKLEEAVKTIQQGVQDVEKRIKAESKITLLDLELGSIPIEEIVSKKLRSIVTTSEKLEPVVQAEAALEQQRQEIDELQGEKAQLDKAISKLKARVAKAPKDVAALKVKLKEKSKSASALEGFELIRENLANDLEELLAIDKQKKMIPQAREVAKAAAGELTLAKNKLSQMQKERMGHYAVELAQKLKKGQACLVCGSKEHPAKAKGSASTPSEIDLEQAERQLEEALQRFQDAETALRVLEASTKRETEKLSKNQKDLKAEISKVNSSIKAALSAKEQADVLEQKIEALEQQREQNQSELDGQRDELSQITQELSQLTKVVLKTEQTVAKSRGKFLSVEARKIAIDALIENLDEIAEFLKEKLQAEVLLENARSELAKLPKSSQFGQTEQSQKLFDELSPLRDEAMTLRDSRRVASEALNQGVLKVNQAIDRRKSKIADSERLVELASVASGANPQRMDLPTYVLNRMFEDVLVAANARFEKVIDSRYRFEISEEQLDKRRSQGLDVAIFDAKTNRQISPKSLSGGEGFSAALALALGLSDAVRANQGGISIDTFFVDEGFGSLDPNRLDQVIKMLTQLKFEGRRVGLVSHVESMKNDFEEKIIVTPVDETGVSTLRTTWSSYV